MESVCKECSRNWVRSEKHESLIKLIREKVIAGNLGFLEVLLIGETLKLVCQLFLPLHLWCVRAAGDLSS